MSTVTRFAPSPTGYLHVGNTRAALVTWLFTRHTGGRFILRIDNTDTERSEEQYEDAIIQDLTWLGLDWDRLEHQAPRMDHYMTRIEELKAAGRVYACYETPEELSLKRKALLGQGKPPIYDRGALELTEDKKAAYEAEGRAPHWRFKLNHDEIIWQDHIRGEVKFQGADLSDPVVIREDGRPLYHLCSVIDDIDYGVTHVTRGEDHVSNTATHIQMFEALGARAPEFIHMPLISGGEGEKLAKRKGSLSIRDLRDDVGLEPLSIISLLARIGTSDPIEPFTDITPLVETFDFKKFSRGSPKFDEDELLRLNAKILHTTSFETVKDRLPEGIDETFWRAVRPNIEKLSDVEEWWHVAQGPIESIIEDPDFVHQAADLLPEAPWTESTWAEWTNAVKEKTDRKGKQLFMPLRVALTGKTSGPELKDLLPLIGRDKALERLKKAS